MPYDHVASSAHDADGAYVGVGWYGVGVGCGVGDGARGAGPGVGPGVASGAGRCVGSRVGVGGALQVPRGVAAAATFGGECDFRRFCFSRGWEGCLGV